MKTNAPPTIIVIVGITGDLARRKLLPAIAQIAKARKLPEEFVLVGISRRAVLPTEVLEGVQDEEGFLRQHLRMFQMNIEDRHEYARLADFLGQQTVTLAPDAQHLFYLSVPPHISGPIITFLGESGLAAGKAKLLLEKPFGTDLTSAEELIAATHQHFNESQVYRIDHYLAKEMAQNILVFRSGNSLLKRTWNNQFIEKIEIIASETIGIEGRLVFYEQTGALRDVVQSHLLQLAALTIMQLPGEDWQQVPARRLQALRLLRPPTQEAVPHVARRGQYQGYADEVNNPHSTIETFASLTLFSDDPQWHGVPIVLTTGKALDRKATEIRLHYAREEQSESNQLVLRIQPHEGISIGLWSKRPGYNRQLERVALDFTYDDYFADLPEAYEQVIVDAIMGDHGLFASGEEIKAAWRILTPVQKVWEMNGAADIILYQPGAMPATIIAAEQSN